MSSTNEILRRGIELACFFFLTNEATLKPASSMNFWDHWYGYFNQFGIQLSWLFHEELTETLVGACLGRLAILTEMSQNQSLDFGNKFQSDFYTSDEMSKFKKCLWLQIAMM